MLLTVQWSQFRIVSPVARMHTPLLHILGAWDGASVPRLVGWGASKDPVTFGDLVGSWWGIPQQFQPKWHRQEMCWAGGILRVEQTTNSIGIYRVSSSIWDSYGKGP